MKPQELLTELTQLTQPVVASGSVTSVSSVSTPPEQESAVMAHRNRPPDQHRLETVERGVQSAVRAFLHEHRAEVLAAIVAAAQGQLAPEPPAAPKRVDVVAQSPCIGCSNPTGFKDHCGRPLCSSCPRRCGWRDCAAPEYGGIMCATHLDASRLLVWGHSVRYVESLLGVSLGLAR